MDNEMQIEEIRKFLQYLANQGKFVDENAAALLWIQENAKKWRDSHTPDNHGCHN